MTRTEIARRLAALYPVRALRGYVRWKVQFDPLYVIALEHLRNDPHPLVDIGCGVGLLAFFLRESGVDCALLGVDFDERKIELARHAARRYRNVEFMVGDARVPLPSGHNVVLLDMLHYCSSDVQQEILRNVAATVPPGGMALIRAGLRDRSWRYKLTWLTDSIGRAIHWMRGAELNYPTREDILRAFDGFDAEITPAWGGTPFNNYLFVLRRGA